MRPPPPLHLPTTKMVPSGAPPMAARTKHGMRAAPGGAGAHARGRGGACLEFWRAAASARPAVRGGCEGMGRGGEVWV